MKTQEKPPVQLSEEERFFQLLIEKKQGTLQELTVLFPTSGLVRESQYIAQFEITGYIKIRRGPMVIESFSFQRFLEEPLDYLIQYFESKKLFRLPKDSWMLTHQGWKIWNRFYAPDFYPFYRKIPLTLRVVF